MSNFISMLLIPLLTLLMPGRTDWFTSNFSVVGADFPQNVFLLLWAIVTGGFYHTFTKRTIGQAAPFFPVGKELALTDMSVFFADRGRLSPLSSGKDSRGRHSAPGHGLHCHRSLLSGSHHGRFKAVFSGA